MYKIPRRMIFCDSIIGWAKEMVWIYFVMKVFKSDIKAITKRYSEGIVYPIPSIEEFFEKNYE